MASPVTASPDPAARLRLALEQTAAALAAADLEAVLAAGETLEVAIAELPSEGDAPLDAVRRRADIQAARAALLRCRRLGLSLSDFTRTALGTHGVSVGYEPSYTAAAALSGRGFSASV